MFVEDGLIDLRRARFTPSAWRIYALSCWRVMRAEALARPEALRSLAVTGFCGLLALLVPACGLALTGRGSLAFVILRDGALTLVAGLCLLGASLRLLRDESGRPLPRINLANLLTLVRLVSIPAFWHFLTRGDVGLALLTFGVGALTDVADGLVARVGRQRTALGRVFDPAVDILFNATLFAALGRLGVIPPWVLALVAVRYGLLVAGAVAITLLYGPVEIRPTIVGKAAGVITTLLLTALMVGVLPQVSAGVAAGLRRVGPLLVLSVGIVEALTLPQVLLIGWLNVRRRRLERAAAELRLVKLPVDAPGRRYGA